MSRKAAIEDPEMARANREYRSLRRGRVDARSPKSMTVRNAERRSKAQAAGFCPTCCARKPESGKRQCGVCIAREARADEAWCMECLASGFHRIGCPSPAAREATKKRKPTEPEVEADS